MDTILTTLYALVAHLTVLLGERQSVDGPLREQVGFRVATALRKQVNRLAADLERAGVELSVGRFGQPRATRRPARTLHAYTALFSTREPDIADVLTFVEYLIARAEATPVRVSALDEALRELSALNELASA